MSVSKNIIFCRESAKDPWYMQINLEKKQINDMPKKRNESIIWKKMLLFVKA